MHTQELLVVRVLTNRLSFDKCGPRVMRKPY